MTIAKPSPSYSSYFDSRGVEYCCDSLERDGTPCAGRTKPTGRWRDMGPPGEAILMPLCLCEAHMALVGTVYRHFPTQALGAIRPETRERMNDAGCWHLVQAAADNIQPPALPQWPVDHPPR